MKGTVWLSLFIIFTVLLIIIIFGGGHEYNDYYERKNIATRLSTLHLQIITGTSGFLSPPDIARALALTNSAMYNAMSVYFKKFRPAYPEYCYYLSKNKRKFNKKEMELAMIVAFKRAIKYIYYNQNHSSIINFNNKVRRMINKRRKYKKDGYHIGKLAAKCIIKRFKYDNSNDNGNLPSTIGIIKYSDNTNYYSINPPQDTPGITNCSKIRNINHWQQLLVPLKGGGYAIRKFLSPQKFRSPGFAIKNGLEFLPLPPPIYGSNTHQQWIDEVNEVIAISGQLDDRKKIIAEYWADGPHSNTPAGHWQELGIELIHQRKLGLMKSTLLLFLQANAANDAGIVTWTAKRIYDFCRPITAIQCSKQNNIAKVWSGPYQGIKLLNLSSWQPYQNIYFVTPPFAEYTSGHSAFSAASAEVFKLFFNSDEMNLEYTVKAGESLFEPKITSGNPGYIAGVTDIANSGPESIGYVPADDITLSWSTFTQAADQSGISRLYGGIHFRSGNLEGLKLGRNVGKKVFIKFINLINHF